MDELWIRFTFNIFQSVRSIDTEFTEIFLEDIFRLSCPLKVFLSNVMVLFINNLSQTNNSVSFEKIQRLTEKDTTGFNGLYSI